MSRTIWEKLLGDTLVSATDADLAGFDLTQSIKKITSIQKDMLASIDTINEPDYIGDFIQRGGLIGLAPMGYNAPSSSTPNVSHTQLAQVALNHSRLETTLNRLKKSLKETFATLNASVSNGNVSFDATTQQALADITTYTESAKEEIKSLVLKPKTVETMYACFEKIDENTKRLQKEFERCARFSK